MITESKKVAIFFPKTEFKFYTLSGKLQMLRCIKVLLLHIQKINNSQRDNGVELR